MSKKEIQAEGLIGKVLMPVDLDALDGLIANLGEKSENLSDTDRAAASRIIDEWLAAIEDRIRYNAATAREMLSFLENEPMGGEAVSNCAGMLHGITGDTPEYLAYEKALHEAMDIRSDRPIARHATSETTVLDAVHVDKENRAEFLAWKRSLAAADMHYAHAVKDYARSVTAMPGISDAMKGLRTYAKSSSRMVKDCRDRAERTKVNLQSNDPGTRALLHELLDFARTLEK